MDDGGTSNGGINTDQTPNTFMFNVTPVNDAPTAASQSVTLNEDGTLTITVTGYDVDKPAVGDVEFTAAPVSHGVLSKVGSPVQNAVDQTKYTQLYLYTPVADYNGQDSFTFTFSTAREGGWSFGPALFIGAETDSTRSIQLGDLDSDGDLDVVVGNWGEPVKVYLNNGTGVFSAPINVNAVAENTNCILLQDMDGDGDLDIVVGNSGYNRLYFNLGLDILGQPTFSGGINIGSDTDNSLWVDVGDVDSDGDLDVVAGNYEQINKLYINQGGRPDNLTFSAGIPLPGGANQTTVVKLLDFDGDGDLDLLVGNYLW